MRRVLIVGSWVLVFACGGAPKPPEMTTPSLPNAPDVPSAPGAPEIPNVKNPNARRGAKPGAVACDPPKISLAVSATDTANYGSDGRGRPVQVRVILLKGETKLQSARFEDIWEKQKDALQEDLIKADEYTVFPGETKTFPVAANADAHSLGVVALFREPQGKQWFISYDLDTGRNATPCPTERRIDVTLDRMQVVDGRVTSDTKGH